MKIEKAVTNDAKGLTELTIRSKSHWDYGEQQMEEWRDELTITEKYIDDNQIYKLVMEDYAFHPINKTDIKLNYLFVEPEFIGKGYGKALLMDFLRRIENTEFKTVTLDADPNVEQFYGGFGFRVIGKLESAIKDRFLPVMQLEIQRAHNGVSN